MNYNILLVGLYLIYCILCGERKFEGIIAATFTPFYDNSTVNLDVIPKYAKYLSERDVKGVFIGGSTGESLSVSIKDRKSIAKKWIVEGQKVGLKVIIHVGSQSLFDSMELAKHAEENGADGIGAMTPTFFKASTPEVVFQICREIANAANKTSFLYYHLPGLTGLKIDITKFFKLAAENISTFAGIKFTDSTLQDMIAIQRYIKTNKRDDLSILFGVDEAFDSGYYLGANGGVGSTYNYASGVYHKIMKYIDEGNNEKAHKWQKRSEHFIRIFASYSSGNVNSNKALAEMTMNISLGPPILPYKPLSNKLKEEMRKELDKIGYFDWYDGKENDDDDDDDDDDNKHNTWLIIGGTIGAVVILIILGYIIYRYTRNKSKNTVNEPLVQKNEP